ncbi:unnamed protein product [Paramecium pentaurelia]|uniref:Uncharacterized protein n=1 Tax=Paramecium pentaurelia TaxID=43138 RepID=A0A8S1YJ22_9CILI|nr:unnamed protein product [Paramecium pentaurelia]
MHPVPLVFLLLRLKVLYDLRNVCQYYKPCHKNLIR